MAIVYPAITPNTISTLELPDYGVITYKFDDDSESRRYRFDTGNHTRLIFKYEGRTEADVANFISFWKAASGLKEAFTIPDTINKHPLAYKSGINLLGTTTLWRFESAPKITTVYSGIYSWDVNLISVFE